MIRSRASPLRAGKSIAPAGRPANTPAVAGSRRLSDAQVLTTALGFFGGNLVVAKHYMEQHWGQNRLDKSGFTRRLHALADTLHALFSLVGDWLKQRHLEARYVLGSFPVAVCHNTRIPRCKLLMGKAYHRRYVSKRSWFYGLKVQVVATSDGIPVELYLPARAGLAGAAWRCICPKVACSTLHRCWLIFAHTLHQAGL